MRYQSQNLGKKLCSLGKVRVYQCFVFRSLGLVLKLEWVRMQWKLQKFVYSYEYFKTVRSKTYYALNTSTRAVNNSSALLLIFVLCPCFICSFGKKFWNQIMNKRQIQKSSFTLRRTTFLMLFLTRYQAQNLGKKLYSLGKVRIYQCFFSIFGFGECPDVAIDWL